MKKTFVMITLAAVGGLLAFVPAPGKDKTFEGKIVYEISYEEVPEMLEPYVAMLPKENVMYVKGDLSRSEQNTMGQSIVYIFDNKKNEGLILMDGMMFQKTAFQIKPEDIKKGETESKPVVIPTKETKTINGYACKKTRFIMPGSTDTLNAWVTDKISAKNFNMKFLDGFPLQYDIQNNGMTMLVTLKTIENQKLNDALFKAPDDYTVKPFSELEKMKNLNLEEEEEDVEGDE